MATIEDLMTNLGNKIAQIPAGPPGATGPTGVGPTGRKVVVRWYL